MMGWWSFSLAALSARVVVGTTWRGACIVPRTDSEGQDYFFQDGRGAGAAFWFSPQFLPPYIIITHTRDTRREPGAGSGVRDVAVGVAVGLWCDGE